MGGSRSSARFGNSSIGGTSLVVVCPSSGDVVEEGSNSSSSGGSGRIYLFPVFNFLFGFVAFFGFVVGCVSSPTMVEGSTVSSTVGSGRTFIFLFGIVVVCTSSPPVVDGGSKPSSTVGSRSISPDFNSLFVFVVDGVPNTSLVSIDSSTVGNSSSRGNGI